MLNLASSTTKLRMVTGSAGSIDWHTSWSDTPVSAPVPSGTQGNVATATTTDIVAATGNSEKRNVKLINIVNVHASVSNKITIQIFDGSTAYKIYEVTLAPSETLLFVEAGWFLFGADGTMKAQSGRMLFKALSADDTGGQNVNTAQPWFPTSGAVTVEGATSYFMEGLLRTTRAAGATSHTTGIGFGGSATLTNIDYFADCRTGDVNTAPGAGDNLSHIQTASNTQVKAASTSATEDTLLMINGIVRINAAGTFTPQFTYSAAPGGAPTIKRGSFFRMWPIGDNNVVSQGVWA